MLEGLKDWKTTILGLAVLGIVSLAMFKGLCTFDKWWEIVLIILGILAGGSLTFMDTRKSDKPQIGPDSASE